MNPHDVDDIFGTQIYSDWGSDILPLWAAGVHGGHTWLTWRDFDCAAEFSKGNNCAKAGRINFHIVFASGKPQTVRFHSGWRELYVCDEIGNCGFKREGGKFDTNQLRIDGVNIPLPDDDLLPFIGNVRKEHRGLGTSPAGGGPSISWYTAFRTNGGFNTQIIAKDGWGPSNPADPFELIFWCPDFQCSFNASRLTIGQNNGGIDPIKYPPSDDGLVDIFQFVDQFGVDAPSCTSIGPDCVPFEAVNLPPGVFGAFQPLSPNTFEGDISPDGEFWIEYPN